MLLALFCILGFALLTRSDVETTILKVPGTLYQKTDDGNITNLYNFEFINKTFEDIPLELKIESPSEATLERVGDQAVIVPAEGLLKGVYFIKMPMTAITTPKNLIILGIYKNGKMIDRIKTKFIAPVTKASDWKR